MNGPLTTLTYKTPIGAKTFVVRVPKSATDAARTSVGLKLKMNSGLYGSRDFLKMIEHRRYLKEWIRENSKPATAEMIAPKVPPRSLHDAQQRVARSRAFIERHSEVMPAHALRNLKGVIAWFDRYIKDQEAAASEPKIELSEPPLGESFLAVYNKIIEERAGLKAGGIGCNYKIVCGGHQSGKTEADKLSRTPSSRNDYTSALLSEAAEIGKLSYDQWLYQNVSDMMRPLETRSERNRRLLLQNSVYGKFRSQPNSVKTTFNTPLGRPIIGDDLAKEAMQRYMEADVLATESFKNLWTVEIPWTEADMIADVARIFTYGNTRDIESWGDMHYHGFEPWPDNHDKPYGDSNMPITPFEYPTAPKTQPVVDSPAVAALRLVLNDRLRIQKQELREKADTESEIAEVEAQLAEVRGDIEQHDRVLDKVGAEIATLINQITLLGGTVD